MSEEPYATDPPRVTKCAKCDRPAVTHVTEVDAGSGQKREFHLCQEHARELTDKLPPGVFPF